jgi:hypothetical protein
VILGVREGYLYRSRGQPMYVVTSRRKEIYEEEHIGPSLVRQVSPLVSQIYRE